jgi:hypothetical protein
MFKITIFRNIFEIDAWTISNIHKSIVFSGFPNASYKYITQLEAKEIKKVSRTRYHIGHGFTVEV